MPRERDEAAAEDRRRLKVKLALEQAKVKEMRKSIARIARENDLHRIRYRQRIRELMDELDVALQFYAPADFEDDGAIERFKAELTRMRGGADITAPIAIEPAKRTHVSRLSLHRAADRIGETPRFVEEATGRYTGQQSEEIDFWGGVPDRCEQCCHARAEVTAAVWVRQKTRRALVRVALCGECYDVAIAADELP